MKVLSEDKLLSLIGEYYLEKYQENEDTNSISLYGGRAGILLFQSLYFKATGDEKYQDAMEDNFSFIINTISNSPELSATFCDGLAGVGWLFQYLGDVEILDIDNEGLFNDLDHFLLMSLDAMLFEKNLDLLHGGLGVALYFLKRKKYDPVRKVVDFLYNESEIANNETKWAIFDPYREKDYIFDLGLAHGMAGVIYFLTKCLENKVAPEKCKEMILGCISFYLNNIQDNVAIGSFFGNYILCKNYSGSDNNAQFSRLAWCYGDLGILHTLYNTSRKLGDEPLTERMELMLLKTITRKDLESTQINDTGICHGSSGAGVIYKDLYTSTGNSIFKDGSDFWKLKTIEFLIEDDTSYEEYFNKQRRELLNGTCGAGLFLLTQKYPCLSNSFKEKWKECFFLR